MTKPEVSKLKHQNMLEKAIIKAKDKSVLSWWWLSIPLYILAGLLMKSIFMPSTTFGSNLHDLMGKEKYSSILFFLIVPIVFIIINVYEYQRNLLSVGKPEIIKLFESRVVQSTHNNCFNHNPFNLFTLKNNNMHLPWFKRIGIFFIPKTFFGWTILIAGLAYAVYVFIRHR